MTDLDTLFDSIKELNELNHSENINDQHLLLDRLTDEKRYRLIAAFFEAKADLVKKFNELQHKQKQLAQIDDMMHELEIFRVFKDELF